MGDMALVAPRLIPDASGCLLWPGAKNSGGYGVVYRNRRARQVHLIVYEATHGPIPDGHDVHHTCHVRHCAEPSHLEAVELHEHRRMGRAKIDWIDVYEIRCLSREGVSRTEVGRLYGLTPSHVRRIVVGEVWN